MYSERKDSLLPSHFWLGSLCRIASRDHNGRQRLSFPSCVVAVIDTIRIIQDFGNNIPNKSWMLYLLELFDSGYGIKAIELNLICQFNDRDNFWAIFGGVNRYKFIKVLPLVGHSYQRQILMRRETNSIEYRVTDLTDVVSESFTFEIASAADRATTSFQGSNHFTGLEWWNKAGNFPFPIRYKVEMSNLKYGQPIDKNREAHDTYENLTYSPFNALAPHLDGYTAKYPAIFTDVGLKDGCICYTLTSGSCSTGLGFVAY